MALSSSLFSTRVGVCRWINKNPLMAVIYLLMLIQLVLVSFYFRYREDLVLSAYIFTDLPSALAYLEHESVFFSQVFEFGLKLVVEHFQLVFLCMRPNLCSSSCFYDSLYLHPVIPVFTECYWTLRLCPLTNNELFVLLITPPTFWVAV